MKFQATGFEGVVLIEPSIYTDRRGSFFETYRKSFFQKNGIDVEFVQDNHSISRKGTLRGLHFQVPPKTQAKLVRVISGSVFDVIVDLRQGSKTFGQNFSITLSHRDPRFLYIPAGFAHGFLALSDQAEFLYQVSDVYSPQHESGIVYSDPDLNIVWPEIGIPLEVSDRDLKLPSFKDITKNPLFSL